MIDDILIIDDVISKDMQDRYESILLSTRVPWAFFRDIAIPASDIQRLGIKKLTPGIGASIIQDNPTYVNQQLLDEFKTIVYSACTKADLVCRQIVQGRSFMHFPLAVELRKEYDNIHIDLMTPHTVCLYYVNDSDGDTFIFDKTSLDIQGRRDIFERTKFNVLKRVTPKKGRVVLFNGNRYHSSSGPTKDVRCIINFDIIT
jgi:hypothetical protein